MEQKSSNNQRKHVIRIKRCKDRFTHARELFREIRTLNVFQLNILNSLVFVHKIKSQTAPKIFQHKFRKPTHKYPKVNYRIPSFKLTKPKYRIWIRSPTFWKSIPANSEKMYESAIVFKNSIRKKFPTLEN